LSGPAGICEPPFFLHQTLKLLDILGRQPQVGSWDLFVAHLLEQHTEALFERMQFVALRKPLGVELFKRLAFQRSSPKSDVV